MWQQTPQHPQHPYTAQSQSQVQAHHQVMTDERYFKLMEDMMIMQRQTNEILLRMVTNSSVHNNGQTAGAAPATATATQPLEPKIEDGAQISHFQTRLGAVV